MKTETNIMISETVGGPTGRAVTATRHNANGDVIEAKRVEFFQPAYRNQSQFERDMRRARRDATAEAKRLIGA